MGHIATSNGRSDQYKVSDASCQPPYSEDCVRAMSIQTCPGPRPLAIGNLSPSATAKPGWSAVQHAVACGLVLAISLIALLGLNGVAHAEDEVVGFIRTLDGAGTIRRGDQTIAAEVGLQVRRNDVLQTTDNATMAVLFRDTTMVSIGSNSRFAIEEYQFNPMQSQYSFLGILLGGSFLYISGDIGHLSPDNVAVRTPVGVIGIRGTRFSASFSQ